jgi:LmbE family N-acetylglucosaminyl deacetylase
VSARDRLVDAYRAWLVSRACDVTDASVNRSALVVAPHPDDETLGCGAVIARKRAAGTTVRVLIASDGRHSGGSEASATLGEQRQRECVEACRRLGVPGEFVQFLGLEDGTLKDVHDLAERVGRAVERAAPDDLFVPCVRDEHPDHRALAAAITAAVADLPIQPEIVAYPVWFWSRAAWVDEGDAALRRRLAPFWRPVSFGIRSELVTIETDGFLAQKRAALAAHSSQLESADGSDRGTFAAPWLARFFRREELFVRMTRGS